jgi:hypothetical protein
MFGLMDVLYSILCGPLLKLLLVFGGGVGGVLCLGVLAVERSSSTVGLEELRCRLIAAHFHDSELIPLPFCFVV